MTSFLCSSLYTNLDTDLIILIQRGREMEKEQYHLLLPTAVIAFTLVHDVLVSVEPSVPKVAQRIWIYLTSPFRNFLYLEDLEEPVKKLDGPPVQKIRALTILPLVQSIGWLGCFVYACVSRDVPMIIQSLLVSITWVRKLSCKIHRFSC